MNEGKNELQQGDERTRECIANLKHMVISAHRKVIEETGGAHGLRDETALDSAISSAFHTFWGEDLFENVHQKAAALMRSMSLDHPFVDGNKRMSLLVSATFLLEYGYGFREDVSDDEIVDVCIEIASGARDVESIVSWLERTTEKASARSFTNVMSQLHQSDVSL